MVLSLNLVMFVLQLRTWREWRLVSNHGRCSHYKGLVNAVVGVIRGHGENTRYFIDGHEVTKEAFDEALPDAPKGGGRAGDSLTGWKPIVSDALAVHPRQVREAVEDAKAKGVPTEFQPDGRPV